MNLISKRLEKPEKAHFRQNIESSITQKPFDILHPNFQHLFIVHISVDPQSLNQIKAF